jgi:hypothetical protein
MKRVTWVAEQSALLAGMLVVPFAVMVAGYLLISHFQDAIVNFVLRH